MSATITFTAPPEVRASPGLPASLMTGGCPPSGALAASLRNIFHPAILKALEGLWQEIENQALVPLFLAEPREGLTQTFQIVHPRFAAYYLAASLAIVENLKEPTLVAEMVEYSFHVIVNSLRTHGPERIGREPATAAAIGVHSVTRTFKAAARYVLTDDTERQRLEADARTWTIVSTAYMLTIFAVFHAVDQGPAFAGRWGNVATLAMWSRAYASQLYNLALRQGLLQAAPRPPGELPVRSDDDDLRLADAGTEDYPGLLKRR
jgi:hypothetical protein